MSRASNCGFPPHSRSSFSVISGTPAPAAAAAAAAPDSAEVKRKRGRPKRKRDGETSPLHSPAAAVPASPSVSAGTATGEAAAWLGSGAGPSEPGNAAAESWGAAVAAETPGTDGQVRDWEACGGGAFTLWLLYTVATLAKVSHHPFASLQSSPSQDGPAVVPGTGDAAAEGEARSGNGGAEGTAAGEQPAGEAAAASGPGDTLGSAEGAQGGAAGGGSGDIEMQEAGAKPEGGAGTAGGQPASCAAGALPAAAAAAAATASGVQ